MTTSRGRCREAPLGLISLISPARTRHGVRMLSNRSIWDKPLVRCWESGYVVCCLVANAIYASHCMRRRSTGAMYQVQITDGHRSNIVSPRPYNLKSYPSPTTLRLWHLSPQSDLSSKSEPRYLRSRSKSGLYETHMARMRSLQQRAHSPSESPTSAKPMPSAIFQTDVNI